MTCPSEGQGPGAFITWFPIPSSWSDFTRFNSPSFLGRHNDTPSFRESPEGGKPRDFESCPWDRTPIACPGAVLPSCSWSQMGTRDARYREPEALVTPLIYWCSRVTLSTQQFSMLLLSPKLLSNSIVSWVKSKFFSQNIKGFNITEFLPKQFNFLIHVCELCARQAGFMALQILSSYFPPIHLTWKKKKKTSCILPNLSELAPTFSPTSSTEISYSMRY